MHDTDDIEVHPLGDWKRTHHCGALRREDIGREALLMGWVNSRRDLGNLIFIDLRDREGITQVVFDPQVDPVSHRRARVLRNEWVLAVKGEVAPRLEGQENPDLATGAVEVKAAELRILNRTEVPPFQVDGKVDASETLRLKHRYLELRRHKVFRNFRKRHEIAAAIRDYFNRNGFIEVETPFLTKSTPEGARDYLVPSRVNRGLFYALPQSPQLFKQLLMIAGFDRYYQIVRCFRDEDLRADRQPEFTQVDVEMSFVDEAAVMGTIEEMVAELFRKILSMDIPLPIPRLTYHEAMDRYGSDKPDLRFGLELQELTDLFRDTEFQAFRRVVEVGGAVKAVLVEKGAPAFSRKGLDELSQVVIAQGAKGLAWAKVSEEGWQSPLGKFFDQEKKAEISRHLGAGPEDLILMLADDRDIVNHALGMLRLELARRLEWLSKQDFALVWITKFPLLEYNAEEQRLEAMHHPFTAPLVEDLPLLEEQPENVRARSYDLVLNGSEIGGGSIRIHDIVMQRKMFDLLGIPQHEADRKFGFLLEALKYGAPPHGGIALGFDRLVAIMTGIESIREVIAFPKTATAACPLTDAPSRVDSRQLQELGLSLRQDD